MRRITIIIILLLAAASASAQRVTKQIALSFQTKTSAQDDTALSLTLWGVHFGAQFEPFYPWPVYLEAMLGATMATAKDGAYNYRLELPLDLTWQWEPAPNFSVGPYAGAYGTYNLWSGYQLGEADVLNALGWGLMGGISMRPGAFLINVGYYRDMMPLRKGEVGADAFRIGRGIRVLVGVCF